MHTQPHEPRAAHAWGGHTVLLAVVHACTCLHMLAHAKLSETTLNHGGVTDTFTAFGI